MEKLENYLNYYYGKGAFSHTQIIIDIANKIIEEEKEKLLKKFEEKLENLVR